MCLFPPNNDTVKISLLYIVMNSHTIVRQSDSHIRKKLLYAFNYCFQVRIISLLGIIHVCGKYILKKKEKSPMKLNACSNSNTNDIYDVTCIQNALVYKRILSSHIIL